MTREGLPTLSGDPRAVEAASIVEAVIPGFKALSAVQLKSGKSLVHAIRSSGEHPQVVVKRAGAETIRIEGSIMRWLMTSELPCVRAYGVVPAGQGQAWLISEFIGGDPFDPDSPDHRVLAGRWLADLHAWSQSSSVPELPQRDLVYHRGVVRAARSTLWDAWQEGSALSDPERQVVLALLESCDRLLALWRRVEDALAGLPTTIVHSGLAAKNARVSDVRGVPAVFAFDWEQGGWGCPAADLSVVDIDAYGEQLAHHGVGGAVGGLVHVVGDAFWCLAGVPGERENLTGPWPHRAAGKLEYYLNHVQSAVSRLGTDES